MIYRDRSAFTTLDNANEGIMSSDYENFRKQFSEEKTSIRDRQFYKYGSESRQPEIDALKRGGSLREVTYLKTEIQLMVEQREKLWREIDALKAENERLTPYVEGFRREEGRADKLDRQVDELNAENERLRKDAEHVCKAAEGLQNASNELWKSENPDEAWAFFEEKTKLMSSDDARQAHVEAWRTLDYAIYYMRKNAAMKDFSTTTKEEQER
jgi:predicted RNase H-like nuclease (RuvC/YqgF family)